MHCLVIDEINTVTCSVHMRQTCYSMSWTGATKRGRESAIFTSNKKPFEWKNLFPDVELAKCVLDRIMDRCIEIEMTQI